MFIAKIKFNFSVFFPGFYREHTLVIHTKCKRKTNNIIYDYLCFRYQKVCLRLPVFFSAALCLNRSFDVKIC